MSKYDRSIKKITRKRVNEMLSEQKRFSKMENQIQTAFEKSSFKWRVTVSGELMFLENYGNCDVTNTVTLLL